LCEVVQNEQYNKDLLINWVYLFVFSLQSQYSDLIFSIHLERCRNLFDKLANRNDTFNYNLESLQMDLLCKPEKSSIHMRNGCSQIIENVSILNMEYLNNLKLVSAYEHWILFFVTLRNNQFLQSVESRDKIFNLFFDSIRSKSTTENTRTFNLAQFLNESTEVGCDLRFNEGDLTSIFTKEEQFNDSDLDVAQSKLAMLVSVFDGEVYHSIFSEKLLLYSCSSNMRIEFVEKLLKFARENTDEYIAKMDFLGHSIKILSHVLNNNGKLEIMEFNRIFTLIDSLTRLCIKTYQINENLEVFQQMYDLFCFFCNKRGDDGKILNLLTNQFKKKLLSLHSEQVNDWVNTANPTTIGCSIV